MLCGMKQPPRWRRLPQDGASHRSFAARLDPALDHIERHLADRLPLSQLAALTGLSLWRFATVFRLAMGLPPHRYITLQRLLLAQRLLAQGQAPSCAAIASGFYDQSHLSRCLKRRCGMTPGQYQASVRPAQASRRPCASSFPPPPPTESPPPCLCPVSKS